MDKAQVVFDKLAGLYTSVKKTKMKDKMYVGMSDAYKKMKGMSKKKKIVVGTGIGAVSASTGARIFLKTDKKK